MLRTPLMGGGCLVVCTLVLTFTTSTAIANDETTFPGWQAMRVIALKGTVDRMTQADLNGDGRPELVLTRPRKSRLEIYRWLPLDQRQDERQLDPNDPNTMPMALDFAREELPFDDPPLSTLAYDVNDDGRDELLVLLKKPLRIEVHGKTEKDGWKELHKYELLDASLSSGDKPMLLNKQGDLYISLHSGLQYFSVISKQKDTAKWLTPREDSSRNNWWFLDLDGDGDQDLVEFSRTGRIHWYESLNGKLLPKTALSEKRVAQIRPLLQPLAHAQLLSLSKVGGTVRSVKLERGEENEFGRRRTLPMRSKNSSLWCGLQIDGQPAIVYPDPAQPRLYVHRLQADGWGEELTFPAIGDLKAMVSLANKPHWLLMLPKDGGELLLSKWENGRLTFPRPWTATKPSKDSEDSSTEENITERRTLNLASDGEQTWWIQKLKNSDGKYHLDLYVWDGSGDHPHRTRYGGDKEIKLDKIDKVRWLGGQRLLVLDKYGGKPKLLSILPNGQLNSSAPSHLKKFKLDQVKLVNTEGHLKLARLSSGVLQWLDQDLQATDQVMLEDGKSLIQYLEVDEKTWALESGGRKLHLLEADSSGVRRSTRTVKLPGGKQMIWDFHLGLILTGAERLTVLSPGTPWKLKQLSAIDSRQVETADSKNSKIHRIATTDINGNGHLEAILFDDIGRRISAFSKQSQQFKPLLSWPVYDDKTYPYGGESGRDLVAEPRIVLGIDLDADGRQDLVLLSHDRLVIYLGQENN